ncbi:hypothetical protein NDU88_003498 [Pleurodeles waltl]|uniref:Uncharacterized protein n=1 Tax=Pleurodeles waltl TaxID=8319 RepID=A0AAV7SFG1_PLEWA|nr:hypothetical protein NDU88_003498 [Pleurodeles waltl]
MQDARHATHASAGWLTAREREDASGELRSPTPQQDRTWQKASGSSRRQQRPRSPNGCDSRNKTPGNTPAPQHQRKELVAEKGAGKRCVKERGGGARGCNFSSCCELSALGIAEPPSPCPLRFPAPQLCIQSKAQGVPPDVAAIHHKAARGISSISSSQAWEL